jgi:hypothetical protein
VQVYAELAADGYDIDYMRVPVTDEKAPKDSDFELLIQRLWAVPLGGHHGSRGPRAGSDFQLLTQRPWAVPVPLGGRPGCRSPQAQHRHSTGSAPWALRPAMAAPGGQASASQDTEPRVSCGCSTSPPTCPLTRRFLPLQPTISSRAC